MKYYHDPVVMSCLTGCPPGTYKEPTNNTCTNCKAGCRTCDTSFSDCKSCISPLFYNSLDNTCVASCPDPYYKNSDNPLNPLCSICNVQCSKCNGPNIDNCQGCKLTSLYYLQQSKFTCLTDCDPGFFENPPDHLCTVCISPCAKCGLDGADCDSCVDGTFLHLRKCLITCPDGFYGEGGGVNLCKPCNTNCLTCTGDQLT